MENRRFYISVTILYLAFCIVGAYFHEFWRDEAFTWLLIEASDSIYEMFMRLGFIGHTKWWYILVYAFSKLTHSYLVLPVVNILFMTIGILLFLKSAPFTRLQKILFIVGFYPLFQYGIISRQYGTIIFLLFAYCYLRPMIYTRPVVIAVVLSLLAAMHPLSLVYAAVIVIVEGIRYFWKREGEFSWDIWVALALMLASMIFIFLDILPPADAQVTIDSTKHFLFFFKSFANGFFPNFHFFHSHLIFQTVAGLILWFFSWFCFRKRAVGLLYYLLSTLSMAAFVMIVYKGFRWHHGFYYIFFITAIWLGCKKKEDQSRFVKTYLTVLIAVQAAIGLYAFGYDIKAPISSGRNAALYMRENGLDKMNKVGIKVLQSSEFAPPKYKYEIDEIQSTLVYLDDKSIYDPIGKEFVLHWHHYADPTYYGTIGFDEILSGLNEASQKLDSDLLIVVSRPPESKAVFIPGDMEKIVDLPAGVRYGESISLYIYKRRHHR